MNGELRDIKPLLEIPDHSYAIYVAVLLLFGLLLFSVVFIVLRKLWLNRKENRKKIYFERLKNVNWEKTKESAYDVTYYGRLLADEPRSQEIYSQIVPMLEPYKYRKDVPEIDDVTLKQYHLLVHVIDETL